MRNGGTKIYCPLCKEFTICKAVSPTQLNEPVARRWYNENYKDVSWFRRARFCSECSDSFLTAEVSEDLIDELIELRLSVKQKNRRIISSLKKKNSWLNREEVIPKDIAIQLIKKSAWWLTHSSGYPVRAPGHASNIYKGNFGWSLDFGANTFLVGLAIERSKKKINDHLSYAADGNLPSIEKLKYDLKLCLRGAVANSNGFEYEGYYPEIGGEMEFGAQAINLNEAVEFLISLTGVKKISSGA